MDRTSIKSQQPWKELPNSLNKKLAVNDPIHLPVSTSSLIDLIKKAQKEACKDVRRPMQHMNKRLASGSGNLPSS